MPKATEQVLPVDKDLRKAVRRALKAGFTCEKRGSGHFMLTAPDGATLNIGSTTCHAGTRDGVRRIMRAVAAAT